MRYYLNNCQNLNHAEIYGGKAMFDLWAQGFEDKVARSLSSGDACLVVSRGDEGKVGFSHYRFTKARQVPGPAGEKRGIWVLEGELEHCEVLPRNEAIRRAPYSRFFNKLGHFNQWSVVRGA